MVYVCQSRVIRFPFTVAVSKNLLLSRGAIASFALLAAGLAGPAVLADTVPSLSELAAPCLACHSLDTDEPSRVGPSLAGIAGRAVGSDKNYEYSEAFTNIASDNMIWDRETLDRFLEQPQAFVAGTAMNYPGMPDPTHRALLLDWLFSDPEAKVTDPADADYYDKPGVEEVLSIAGDAEYGEYLAGECLTCHQQSDNNGRVPPIHNLTPDYFVFALLEYQNGVRENSVMQTISDALGPEEIAALSAVFSQQSSDN